MESLHEHADPPTLVAGRRLVRRLGAGQRWTAYSTVPGETAVRTDAADPGPRATVAGDTVLLRARADAAERRLWRRAAVLSRLEHPHVLRLLDVAEDTTGLPCLLVERLTGGTLADLLLRRQTIAPGEAVTILVPIIDAVRAAHLAGYCHGDVSPRAVAFADDGRPVLAGWSEARTVEPGARSGPDPLGTAARFAADWHAMGALIDDVLEASTSPETSTFTPWITEAVSACTDTELANRLQQRIHALARPLPVLLDVATESTTSVAASLRASADATPVSGVPVSRRAAVEERRQAGPAVGLMSRLRATGHRPERRRTPPGRSARPRRVVATTSTRRRAIVSGVCLAAAVTAGVLVVVPAGSGEPTLQAAGFVAGQTPTTTVVPSTGATAVERSVPPEADRSTGASDAVAGPDPLIATAELLARRERCSMRAERADCARDYAEPGSALLDADVMGVSPGAIDVASLELADRQGDAAMIRAVVVGGEDDATAAPYAERQPVTLLVMRGETGWRLREVFSAG